MLIPEILPRKRAPRDPSQPARPAAGGGAEVTDQGRHRDAAVSPSRLTRVRAAAGPRRGETAPLLGVRPALGRTPRTCPRRSAAGPRSRRERCRAATRRRRGRTRGCRAAEAAITIRSKRSSAIAWRSAWRRLRPRTIRASTGIPASVARCSTASSSGIAIEHWRGSGLSSGRSSDTRARNTGTSVAPSAAASRSAASSARCDSAPATNGNRIRRALVARTGAGRRRRSRTQAATERDHGDGQDHDHCYQHDGHVESPFTRLVRSATIRRSTPGSSASRRSGRARLGEPSQRSARLGRAHQDVGGAAVVRDALRDRGDVVAVLDQQVRAEHAGQLPQRVELLLLVGVRVVVGHPQHVELGAEPLGRAPGAADHALGSRVRLDQRQQPLADGAAAPRCRPAGRRRGGRRRRPGSAWPRPPRRPGAARPRAAPRGSRP